MKRTRLFKYTLTLIIGLMAFLGAWVTAYTDVVWEPNDNFYMREAENCERENRSYIANGQKGYVTVYKNPKSSKVVGRFENGNIFFVSFTYTDKDDRVWGVVQYSEGEDGKIKTSYSGDARTGWIPMEELLVRYDHQSFCNDHEDEFKGYAGDFDAHAYDGDILFWSYPGSGVINSSVNMKSWKEEQIDFSFTYTDEDGREWGYVGYFFANRGWVCISDPTNKDLPVVEVEYENLVPASKPQNSLSNDDREDGDGFPALLLIGLVAGVVVLTAVLIRVFWPQKRN